VLAVHVCLGAYESGTTSSSGLLHFDTLLPQVAGTGDDVAGNKKTHSRHIWGYTLDLEPATDTENLATAADLVCVGEESEQRVIEWTCTSTMQLEVKCVCIAEVIKVNQKHGGGEHGVKGAGGQGE